MASHADVEPVLLVDEEEHHARRLPRFERNVPAALLRVRSGGGDRRGRLILLQ